MNQELNFENNRETQTPLLSKETKLVGNIETTENLIIHGKVIGEVRCKDLTVSGMIKGNIYCENMIANEAIILGDLQIEKSAEINGKTSIIGDVTIADLTLNGRIRGNIQANTVSINAAGAVVGDISTSTIAIAAGSIIQGRISIDKEVYFDDEII